MTSWTPPTRSTSDITYLPAGCRSASSGTPAPILSMSSRVSFTPAS